MTLSVIDKSKLNKMAMICVAELSVPSYMPDSLSAVTMKARFKVFVKFFLGLSTRQPDYSYFWTTAVLADAIAEYISVEKDVFFLTELKKFYKKSQNKVSFKRPFYVDEVMNCNSLTDLLGHEDSEWMQASVQGSVDFLLNSHAKTTSGVLPYRRPSRLLYRQLNINSALVDTLGMICPFLSKYGVIFNCQPAISLASKQLYEFIKKGFSTESGLPYHGYSYIPEENLGGEGWGRGLGWFLLGIIGVLEFLPEDDVNYPYFLNFYRNLIENVFNRQSNCGAFTAQLLDESSAPDSGATGMIAYACAKGVELNLIDGTYIHRCKKAFDFILSVTDENGRVKECSGEALGANIYSSERGWYPWGQGPAVSLGACLLKL